VGGIKRLLQPVERIAAIVRRVGHHFAAAGAQPVHGGVVGDGEGPGAPGRTPGGVAGTRRNDAQPGVLEHLVSLRRQRAAEQAPHEAEQRPFVASIEHIERTGIAARIGQHQIVVGHVGKGHGQIFTPRCTARPVLRG